MHSLEKHVQTDLRSVLLNLEHLEYLEILDLPLVLVDLVDLMFHGARTILKNEYEI